MAALSRNSPSLSPVGCELLAHANVRSFSARIVSPEEEKSVDRSPTWGIQAGVQMEIYHKVTEGLALLEKQGTEAEGGKCLESSRRRSSAGAAKALDEAARALKQHLDEEELKALESSRKRAAEELEMRRSLLASMPVRTQEEKDRELAAFKASSRLRDAYAIAEVRASGRRPTMTHTASPPTSAPTSPTSPTSPSSNNQGRFVRGDRAQKQQHEESLLPQDEREARSSGFVDYSECGLGLGNSSVGGVMVAREPWGQDHTALLLSSSTASSSAEVEQAEKDRLFHLLDTNGDGCLSRDEVVEGAPLLGLSPAQAAALFDQLDTNGDGELSRWSKTTGWLGFFLLHFLVVQFGHFDPCSSYN